MLKSTRNGAFQHERLVARSELRNRGLQVRILPGVLRGRLQPARDGFSPSRELLMRCPEGPCRALLLPPPAAGLQSSVACISAVIPVWPKHALSSWLTKLPDRSSSVRHDARKAMNGLGQRATPAAS